MQKIPHQPPLSIRSWRERIEVNRLAKKKLSVDAHERRNGRLKAQRGSAVVEFGLILPILLLLLLGSIEGSLALYDKAVITNASREGARAGIVARNPKLSDADIREVVLAYANGSLINFGPSHSPPIVNVVQSTAGTNPSTLEVTVSYTFQGLGLGALFSAVGQPWVLTSSTVMVHE